jgi:hypothetical protein
MSNIKLSILIPSTHTRVKTFLPKIQDQIFGQYNELSAFDQQQVEIIILTDTKSVMLGEKRNRLVDMAQGEYVVFVDDDDVISDDYIKTLFAATKKGADVISFTAMVSLNGETAKPCYYSKDNRKDYNTNDAYYRIPNHICCIKKESALKSSFPNIQYGEDSAFSKLLLPHLKTELKLDKILYYYNFNSETTETQEHLTPNVRRRQLPPVVDVVILSNAKDRNLWVMTQKAIDSCIAGANSLPVNVVVIEQNKKATYKNCTTHYVLDKFNYNAFANIGARKGSAEWVMICNNDLQFTSGWLHSLLIADHPVMSPKCPHDYRQKDIEENEIGDKCGRNLSGWAIFLKREIYNRISGFDEDFGFYCADNSFIEQIKAIGILPMLVPSSIVKHLGSSTLRTVTNKQQYDELTFGCVHKFNTKYGKDLFSNNQQFKNWKLKNKLT